jgi:mannose-6-phosphate isomerase-like protein (cupin superfamily)
LKPSPAPYRDGGIFGGSFSGDSQWERHPHGDEIVDIVNGATTLTFIAPDAEAPQSFAMTAGMLIVIPQGCWHLLQAPVGVTLMTVTPHPTEHLAADDPRSVALCAQLSAWRQHGGGDALHGLPVWRSLLVLPRGPCRGLWPRMSLVACPAAACNARLGRPGPRGAL